MKRAVFFDLDDTLCDAAPAFAAGRRAAFARALAVAPGLSRSALWRAWRQAHADLMPQLEAGALAMAEVRALRFRRTLASVGVADPAGALAEQLDTLLGETQLAHLRCFADVAALATLRERGVFVGVITNGADDTHSDSQRTKAERLGLLALVDGFWVSDTMGYRKPDPRAFVPALAAAGCATGACLYVGDTLATDIAGANAAGLRSVLLRRAPADAASTAETVDARLPQPWCVIHSLWETLDLLNDKGVRGDDHAQNIRESQRESSSHRGQAGGVRRADRAAAAGARPLAGAARAGGAALAHLRLPYRDGAAGASLRQSGAGAGAGAGDARRRATAVSASLHPPDRRADGG